MSNTSTGKHPTSQTSKKRLIIDEIGRDTKTGIIGRGYSPDNGKTFYVLDTIYGRLYGANDINAIWKNGTSDRVKKEVDSATSEIPAVKSAADEAVKKADSAIASSKVNSDAIVAQSEAISEAKSAMDSATAEIQQIASNAASDAAKIRADVAQVQNEVDTAKAANSASVEALKSDVSAAKQDLADVHDSLTKAQAAAEERQKAIDNSIAQINSDIEQDRKDIASAQQANDDTAKQLDTYSKQAQDQGKTIKSIQDEQDGFTATLADVQGNVTQVSDKVDGLSASLKDAQNNVASIKAQADQLSATLTDHAKSIATLTASAKELSSTLEDADGRLSKVEQTAQTNSSTLSDVQGDLSQVKQDATTLTSTLKDAQGNISTLQHKADSVSAQLASAQGDIASLQTDVTGIKATLVSHEGDIHTLQADSKSLHDSMQDAQGDISTLKKTSTDVTSELKDHDGRMSKVEQTASTLTNEFSDQQGRLNKVEQTAQGTQQTVANQQGQINTIKTDASGIHETLTGQGNQIATINVTLNGLSSKYEGVEKSSDELKNRLNNLSVGTRNLLHDTSDQYRTLAGDGRLEKSTASDIYTSVANYHGGDYFTYAATITNPSTKNAMLEVCLLDANKNPLSASGQAYPVLVHSDSVAPGIWNIRENISFRITSNTWFIRTYVVFDGDNTPVGSQVQVKDERLVEGSMAGTWSPNPDDVADKITTNSTQIDQNKKAITLKADQTTVDNLSGEVSQNSAQLKVQAGQISSKVSSTDFTALNNKAMQNRGTVNSPDFNSLTQAGYYTITDPIHGKNYPTSNWGTLEVSGQVSDANGRLNQKYVSDNNGTAYIRQYNVSTKSWTAWVKEANQYDIETLSGKITTNSTQITQNRQAIALKADQATVNNLSGQVSQAQAQLKVQADQISSKVTATDVNNIVDSKGYATTSTVQSLITQKAGTINESITNLTSKVNSNNGGGVNLLKNSEGPFRPTGINTTTIADNYGIYDSSTVNMIQGQTYTVSGQTNGVWSGTHDPNTISNKCVLWLVNDQISIVISADTMPHTFTWNYPTGTRKLRVNAYHKGADNTIYAEKIKIERGTVATPWTPAPSDNATVTQVQQITASIDGIQSTVANKADKSQITQLSNVIQSKVSASDFTSKVTQLSTDINARVTKGDLLSQLNLEAGRTLIQSNKIYLDANSVIMGPNTKAFIPSAAITNVDADKVSAGTIKGVNLLINNGTDTTTVNNSGITNAGLAPNQKDHYTVTRIDNGVVKFGNVSPNDVKNKTSDNLFMDPEGLTKDWTVKGKIDQQNLYDTKYSVAQLDKQDVISQSIQDSVTKQKDVKLDISFYAKADNDGDNLQFSYNQSQTLQKLSTDYQKYSYTITNKVDFDSSVISFAGDKDNKGLIYVTEPVLTRQLTDIELENQAINRIDENYDSSIFGNDGNLFESSKGTITLHAGDLLNDATQWNSDGTQISRAIPQAEIKLIPSIDGKSGRINLTSSNSVIDMDEDTLTIFNTIGDASRGGGVQIQGLGITGSTVWSSDNYFAIGSQKTQSYTVVNAQSFQSQSVLSSKTRIKRLDRKEALSTIMRDDIYTYLYKSDVQLGLTKRHASLVIDDENDVAQYRAPEEFISENGNARDDGTQLGYLIAAVQYQQEQIEELKKKLEEK